MQGWQTTYLGVRELPRDSTAFELQAFFTFSHAERELIGARRGESLKLGLALHIGFLHMSGHVADQREHDRDQVRTSGRVGRRQPRYPSSSGRILRASSCSSPVAKQSADPGSCCWTSRHRASTCGISSICSRR